MSRQFSSSFRNLGFSAGSRLGTLSLMSYDDDDDYDPYDSDGEIEYESDDSDVTIACPYCGTDMYDDAEQCPHCGQYISDEDRPRESKPWWIVAGVVVCLVLMLWWIVAGLS